MLIFSTYVVQKDNIFLIWPTITTENCVGCALTMFYSHSLVANNEGEIMKRSDVNRNLSYIANVPTGLQLACNKMKAYGISVKSP